MLVTRHLFQTSIGNKKLIFNVDSIYLFSVSLDLLWKFYHILYATNYIVYGVHEKIVCIFVHIYFGRDTEYFLLAKLV